MKRECVKTIGVKFCGGCNPQIDRNRLYVRFIERLPQKVYFDSQARLLPWDIGIMIAGCSTACVDCADVRKMASHWILITGAMVDGFSKPESDLLDAAIIRVLEILNSLEGYPAKSYLECRTE